MPKQPMDEDDSSGNVKIGDSLVTSVPSNTGEGDTSSASSPSRPPSSNLKSTTYSYVRTKDRETKLRGAAASASASASKTEGGHPRDTSRPIEPEQISNKTKHKYVRTKERSKLRQPSSGSEQINSLPTPGAIAVGRIDSSLSFGISNTEHNSEQTNDQKSINTSNKTIDTLDNHNNNPSSNLIVAEIVESPSVVNAIATAMDNDLLASQQQHHRLIRRLLICVVVVVVLLVIAVIAVVVETTELLTSSSDTTTPSPTPSALPSETPTLSPSLFPWTWSALGPTIDFSNDDSGFGRIVALNGDGTIVATTLTSNSTYDTSYYHYWIQVFELQNSDSQWEQRGETIEYGNTTIAASAVIDSSYAPALAIDDQGNLLVVGDVRIGVSPDQANTTTSTTVVAYELQQGTSAWVQRGQSLLGLYEDDLFGFTLAISGDGITLVVGAPNSNRATGYVRVFEYFGNTRSWEVDATFWGDNEGANFGYDVDIDHSRTAIAVGIPGAGDEAGQVNIYKTTSTDAWTLSETPLVGVRDGMSLGYAVAVSDDGAVVAAGCGDGTGDVLIHYSDYDGNHYVQTIVSNVSSTAASTALGISDDGTYVAVGIPQASEAVRVFYYTTTRDNGNTTAEFQQRGQSLSSGTYFDNDNFGSSVALDRNGTVLAIGSRGFGDASQIRIFELGY